MNQRLRSYCIWLLLQKRKLRIREVTHLPQGHTAHLQLYKRQGTELLMTMMLIKTSVGTGPKPNQNKNKTQQKQTQNKHVMGNLVLQFQLTRNGWVSCATLITPFLKTTFYLYHSWVMTFLDRGLRGKPCLQDYPHGLLPGAQVPVIPGTGFNKPLVVISLLITASFLEERLQKGQREAGHLPQ